ncbi:Rrf2 family transcriptional regulator [Desulfovibrio sp. OttesenSCG-928-C06]|nr:Rrf2 family transcriptional regulator [Desulfovibrio sp. OttesenSCG-928-C06]
MKLSPNTRYAIRILFELHGLDAPVSTAWLSEKTGISLRTVENIHAVLKQNDITSGTVGAKGGLRLMRPLSEISLGHLVLLFDDGVAFSVCCGDKSNECPNQHTCEIRTAWNHVSDAIQEQLDSVSLESVLQRYPRDGHGFVLNKFY